MALTVTHTQVGTAISDGTIITFTLAGGQDDYYSVQYRRESESAYSQLVYFTNSTYVFEAWNSLVGTDIEFVFTAENNNPEDVVRQTITVEDLRITGSIVEPAPFDIPTFCNQGYTSGKVTATGGVGRLTLQLKEITWVDSNSSYRPSQPELSDFTQPELSPFGEGITEVTIDPGEEVEYTWNPKLLKDITFEVTDENGSRFVPGHRTIYYSADILDMVPIMTYNNAAQYWATGSLLRPKPITSTTPGVAPTELEYGVYFSRVSRIDDTSMLQLFTGTYSNGLGNTDDSEIALFSAGSDNDSGNDINMVFAWADRTTTSTEYWGDITLPHGTYQITRLAEGGCPNGDTVTYSTPNLDPDEELPEATIPLFNYAPPACTADNMGILYIDRYTDSNNPDYRSFAIIVLDEEGNQVELSEVDIHYTQRFAAPRNYTRSGYQLDPGTYTFHFRGAYGWYANTIGLQLTEGYAPRIEFLRWVYPECHESGYFTSQKVEFVIHGGNKPFGYQLSRSQTTHPSITTFDTIPNTPVQAEWRAGYTHIYATDSIGCTDAFQLPDPPTDDPLWQPVRLYVPLIVDRRPIPTLDCSLDNFGAEELTFDVTLGEGAEELTYPVNLTFESYAYDTVGGGYPQTYRWEEVVTVNSPDETATVTIPNPGDLPQYAGLWSGVTQYNPILGCHRVEYTALDTSPFTGTFSVNSSDIRNVSEYGGSDGRIYLTYSIGPDAEGESLSLEQSHNGGPWTFVHDINYNGYQYNSFTISDLSAGEYRFRAISNNDPSCVKLVDTITLTQPPEPPIYADRVTYTKDGISTTVDSLGGYGIEEIHWPDATVYLESLILQDDNKNSFEIYVENGQLTTRAIS